jgi:hypothetical protein
LKRGETYHQPQPHVSILDRPEAFIEPTHAIEARTAHNGCRRPDRCVAQEVFHPEPPGFHVARQSLGHRSRVPAAAEEIKTARRFGCLELHLGLLRMPPVVGIKKGDPFALRGTDTRVPRGGQSTVFLIDVAYPPEVRLEALARVVRATVVDHDNFYLAWPRLP